MLSLEVSRAPALPGQALAIRGLGQADLPMKVRFAGEEMITASNGSRFLALSGTGAFFPPGQYNLEIEVSGQPPWRQPWHVAPSQWTFESINYTGQAATIDAETIRQERQRLAVIWGHVTPTPMWSADFEEPLMDYLGYSSLYGARRSYNNGPYDRYHEGLDYSAYGGTVVYAPAAGRVVLAEDLAARGGAVIIDHGLGVFSGYYHLSEVVAATQEQVVAGEAIGRVGSTGLSTGNHLHWDLLVGGIWVDPAAWRDSHIACWLLEGLGLPCPDSVDQ
jgi:murein DD-endopeptidase MepM/ murein hydrolase activator NlpD